MKEVISLAIAIIASLFFCAFAFYIFYSKIECNRIKNNTNKRMTSFWRLAVISFCLRIILTFFYTGHSSDMNCFNAWAEHIYADGFSSFYSSDMFTDYPPGYMYILYILGLFKDIFNLQTVTSYILLKLPAIICDILCGFVVYKLSLKYNNEKASTLMALFFLLNPAIIFNSSIWGQVDSVFTLFVLMMLYFLNENKMCRAYFSFALAIFIKPQALFYAPVLVFGIIENVFLNDFSKTKFFKNLLFGILSIISIFLLAAPFGISNVVEQYKSTIGSYNYISVNAYNLWTAIGLNWVDTNIFVNVISYFMILITVIVSAYVFFAKKYENRYFLTSAFICFSTFMLSIKMHERYAFPVVVLMLSAFIISLSRKEFAIFIGISIAQLLNMVHVLFYYNPETYYSSGFNKIGVLISFASLLLLIFFWNYFIKGIQTKPEKESIIKTDFVKTTKMTRIDFMLMLIITCIYSVVSLYNLGDKTAPQNGIEISSPVTIELDRETNISELMFYLGANELSDERSFDIKIENENRYTTYKSTLTDGAVFYWNTEYTDCYGKYITLSPSQPTFIMELAIKDMENNIFPSSYPKKLFDEQNTVPEFVSYRNSTYFDEIYHARTAYEFENHLEVYEWTHPPLGKVFIALGTKVFGMTPFGWRISGTLFGIFMIPIIYLFLKKIFGLTWIAVCASIVFSADFMHFTQTRIATIDVYVTFFIMLMYLFMYKYYMLKADAPLKKMFLPLLLSGISTGLAISCKWTGVYAAVGLAVIFFISLYGKYQENPATFKDKILKTILFCVIVFGVVPVLIYIISYIPFMRSNETGFMGIIQNQIDMLTYHGETVLDAEHSFSSPWYQWSINYRPIWYYTGTNGVKSENISSFGNPLVWWTGIIAFIYTMRDALKTKNKNAIFLTISYLAQLIPWMGVTRITFIYHYFPCVPFVVLMISHCFFRLYQKNKYAKAGFITFSLIAVILFIVFYPVISGYPVTEDFVRSFLKWLPSWQLI